MSTKTKRPATNGQAPKTPATEQRLLVTTYRDLDQLIWGLERLSQGVTKPITLGRADQERQEMVTVPYKLGEGVTKALARNLVRLRAKLREIEAYREELQKRLTTFQSETRALVESASEYGADEKRRVERERQEALAALAAEVNAELLEERAKPVEVEVVPISYDQLRFEDNEEAGTTITPAILEAIDPVLEY